jgi:hypothetical protein
MFNSLKLYLIAGAAATLVAFGAWVIHLYNENQRLAVENEIKTQNEQALKDSITVMAGKITTLTSFVANLNDEKTKLKNENIALRSYTKVLIDSIEAIGEAQTSVSDSGITVKFQGVKSIAKFEGFTLYDQRTKKGTYKLELRFLPIDVKAELYEDETDHLWKYRTTSLTEGINVKGTSILDEATYMRLQKYKPKQLPKNFGINLQSPAFKDLFGGITLRLREQYWLNVNYKLTNSAAKWQDNLLLGLHYFIF